MDVSNVLPIGTVVKLKEADKRVMIIGIMQQTEDENGSLLFDYIGIPYPEGFLGAESTVFFQHEDLEGIVTLGYNDFERQSFMASLAEEIDKYNAVKAERTNEQAAEQKNEREGMPQTEEKQK